MADPYSYCASLNRDQWAWEFLRRNPMYQADYRQFIARWHGLEADYGVPPNRDFQRWKQDARAYGPLPGTTPIEQPDVGDLCIGEGERVLLECWMGAKWGFHKFPLDPERILPAPDELSWRALPSKSAHDIDERYRLDIAFDLSLPLPPQLDTARVRLVSRVAELRRVGLAAPWGVANQREHWTQLLQVLDGPTRHAAQQSRLRVAAQAMVNGGYLEILRLAE